MKKLEAVDLYESLVAVQRNTDDFYRTIGTMDQYQVFEAKCRELAAFVDRGLGSNESMALLGIELHAIDQLP